MTKKTKKKGAIATYIESAMDEWGKITWPTKDQTALLTTVTVIVSILVAGFIGVLDLGFSELYKWALELV